MKFTRFLIIFGILLITSFFLHLIMHGTEFTIAHVSDALFVVGIVMFLPALIAVTGAFQVFDGIKYAFRSFFSTNFRREYQKINEYKEARNQKVESTIYIELLIASFIILATGILLVIGDIL